MSRQPRCQHRIDDGGHGFRDHPQPGNERRHAQQQLEVLRNEEKQREKHQHRDHVDRHGKTELAIAEEPDVQQWFWQSCLTAQEDPQQDATGGGRGDSESRASTPAFV